jgi:hypothetical protein
MFYRGTSPCLLKHTSLRSDQEHLDGKICVVNMANASGHAATPEAEAARREKIRRTQTGKKHTPTARRRMREAAYERSLRASLYGAATFHGEEI